MTSASPSTSDLPRTALSWEQAGDSTVLSHGTAELARYIRGDGIERVLSPRPFAHPVRTLGGAVVTDTGPDDHLHHFGLSAALPDVNGTSFWGGRTFVRDQGSTLLDNHGRQRVIETVVGVAPGGDPASADTVRQILRWDDEHGAPVLREERALTARLLPDDDAWALHWSSALHADQDLTFGSPATNGRPGAGYGGLFWRLGPSDDTLVLSSWGVGEHIAHGSTSRWVGFVQRDGDAAVTLLLAQPGEILPWFLRATEYDGASPAVAWDTPRHVARGGRLDLRLVGIMLDRAVTIPEAEGIVARTLAAFA